MGLNPYTTWTSMPPATLARVASDYLFYDQICQALVEKRKALGFRIWPDVSFTWGEGLVGSIADNNDGTFTLTDGTSPANDWSSTGDPDFSGKVWAGGSSPNTPYRPTSFDLIISFNDQDASQQVRAQIQDNTATTLTIKDYRDYVTAACIKSIDAKGCRFFIIKRDGLWWADRDDNKSRWFDWPNVSEDDVGTIAQAKDKDGNPRKDRVVLNSTVGYSAGVGRFKGAAREILFYDTNQKLRRVAITDNKLTEATDTSIPEDVGSPLVLFTALTVAPADGSVYSIVSPGAMAFPGRFGAGLGQRQHWYHGVMESHDVHDAEDPVQPTSRKVIAQSAPITFDNGTDLAFCGCTSPPGICDHDAFYIDVHGDPEAICDPSIADKFFAPRFYKCLGGIQASIEGLCPNFIPPDASGRPGYMGNPNLLFTPALLFNLCGINGGAAAVLDPVSGNYHASVSSLYEGQSVYWTILKESTKYGYGRGTERLSGISTVSGGQIDLGDTLWDAAHELVVPGEPSDVGSTVYYSAGWTRHFQKRFRNMYPGTCFVPDTDTDPMTLEDFAIYPAAVQDFVASGCFGVGTWEKRAASTQLMTFDQYGYANEDGPAFAVGDWATYAGESWTYPLPDDGSSAALMPYYDRFSQHRHPDNDKEHHQGTHEQQLVDAAGKITAAGSYFLTDDQKDWWAHWYSGGEMRVESGTATSAGATSITDSAAAAGTSRNCFWQASRFVGFDFAWQGFVVEIDHAGKTYKLPITGCTPATGTLTFASVGVTFSAGDAYRIREPGTTLNRYATKKVKIFRDDDSSFTLTILFSDRDTLYFDPAEVAKQSKSGLQVGWTFTIVEYWPGWSYRWNGTEWELPDKIDGRKQPADWAKGFGKVRSGDYRTPTLFAEIYATLNALFLTQHSFSYVAHPSEGAADDSNQKFGSTYAAAGLQPRYDVDTPNLGAGAPANFNTALAQAASDWATAFPGFFTATASGYPAASTTVSTVAPNPFIGGGSDTGVCGQATYEAAYFYGRVVPPAGAAFLGNLVQCYAFPQVDNLDSTPDVPAPDPSSDPGSFNLVAFEGDGYGGPFGWHQWTKVATVSSGPGDSTAPKYTDKIGPKIDASAPGLSLPPYPNDYISVAHTSITIEVVRGLDLGNHTAIANWRAGMKFQGDWVVKKA